MPVRAVNLRHHVEDAEREVQVRGSRKRQEGYSPLMFGFISFVVSVELSLLDIF